MRREGSDGPDHPSITPPAPLCSGIPSAGSHAAPRPSPRDTAHPGDSGDSGPVPGVPASGTHDHTTHDHGTHHNATHHDVTLDTATPEPAGHDHAGDGDHSRGHDGRHGHGPGALHGHHGHGPQGHTHAVGADADRRYLLGALGLLGAFLVAEVVVAVWSGSLALLSDAGHMLSDVGAIAGALWAMRLAARPAAGAWTFGWKRAEIVSAALNGLTLLVVGAVVGVEAVRRLVVPPEVEGGPVLAVALVGCVVSVAAAWLLARANRTSLNVEGAYQHVLTDLYGFVGTAAAGLVILLTGWTRADAIASLVVVALMLRAGWGLVRAAGYVLLEAAPESVELDELRAHLLAVDHVHDVHDLHAWTVTSDLPAVSAHLVVDDSCFRDAHVPVLLDEVQACLRGHFDVEHSTFQLEPAAHAAHEGATH